MLLFQGWVKFKKGLGFYDIFLVFHSGCCHGFPVLHCSLSLCESKDCSGRKPFVIVGEKCEGEQYHTVQAIYFFKIVGGYSTLQK